MTWRVVELTTRARECGVCHKIEIVEGDADSDYFTCEPCGIEIGLYDNPQWRCEQCGKFRSKRSDLRSPKHRVCDAEQNRIDSGLHELYGVSQGVRRRHGS